MSEKSQGNPAVECIGTCGYNADDRETAMVVVQRADDGTPTVWCDPCLEPLVRALNEGGLPTVASCCGHRHRPGRITLADGGELFIAADYDTAQAIDRSFPTDINGDHFCPDCREWDGERICPNLPPYNGSPSPNPCGRGES